MKKLTDCELMDIIDQKYNLKNTLNLFKEEGSVIPVAKLQTQMDAIDRKFKYILSGKVIEDLEKGRVKAVYNEELNLPKFLPVWGAVRPEGLVVYVNLTPYRGIKFDNKGYLDGDVRTIYSVLQAGTILHGYYENHKRIVGNIGFVKLAMTAYTKLFLKVLDKLYGIRLNKVKANILAYSVAKFFLINLCEKEDSANTNAIAYNVCEGVVNERLIKSFDQGYKAEEIYKNLSSFLQFLSTNEEMVRDLSMREFYQNWIVMYDFSTTLSIELLEHLIILVGHVVVGSNVNKITVLDNLLKVEANKIYTEFASIIKN
jgi:hypothetical protein